MEVLVQEVWDNQFGSNVTKTVGENWFMMSSPWPIVIIAGIYLYFVLDYGPKMMKSKPAFDLKMPIRAYNLAMIIFSAWWVGQIVFDYQMAMSMTNVCKPSLFANPSVDQKIATMSWLYLMSKYVELLDTVFFILRRKQNQVTFLHVFHHTDMAVSTWFFVKYVFGSQLLLLGLINSFVHVVMYSYYFLASFGEWIQKYLWWKRYITRLQIAQFLIVIIYLLGLVCFNCDIRPPFFIFAVINTIAFLLLFMNFYWKSYRQKGKGIKNIGQKRVKAD